MTTTIPTYPHDLFADEALAEPTEHYRALHELGPLVWPEAHGMYILPRHAEVRAALRDSATFCSGHGVGLNDMVNEQGRGTTLMSDREHHNAQRKLLFGPLTPKALSSIQESVQTQADTLVAALVDRGHFDGVAPIVEHTTTGRLNSGWLAETPGRVPDGAARV